MIITYRDKCRSDFIEKYSNLWILYRRRGRPLTMLPSHIGIEDFYDNMVRICKEFMEWRMLHLDSESGLCKRIIVNFRLGRTIVNGKAVSRTTQGSVTAPIHSVFRTRGEIQFEINLGTIFFKYCLRLIAEHDDLLWEDIENHMVYTMLETISHEFVHIEQYHTERLVYEHQERRFKWNGEIVDHVTKTFNQYKNLPWEKEAFARAENIVKGYVIRHNIKHGTELMEDYSCNSN